MMPWGVKRMMQCKWAIDDTTIGGGGRQRQATTGDGSSVTAGDGSCKGNQRQANAAAATATATGGRQQLRWWATAGKGSCKDG